MPTVCKTPYQGTDLLSIRDYSREDLDYFLHAAQECMQHPERRPLANRVLASCFFEPSTRTRLSFEAAMLQLGGSCIGFSDSTTTSVQKGETLADSIRVIGAYADILVIRHPIAGSAKIAAEAALVPVVNAGDGPNEHPTQTLVDLYSILQCQQRIDGLQIALAGDLKFARTAHSLCYALAQYRVRLFFVADPAFLPPPQLLAWLDEKKVPYSCHHRLEKAIPHADILYMTRIQKERIPNFDLSFSNPCILKAHHLELAPKHLKILHPLPRREELEETMDTTPHAYYFEQAAHGVVVRKAILSLLLQSS